MKDGWEQYIQDKSVKKAKKTSTFSKRTSSSKDKKGIHGVLFDKNTSNVTKLILPNNQLTGMYLRM